MEDRPGLRAEGDDGTAAVSKLFHAGPYRFQMGLRPASAAIFFSATSDRDFLLGRRRHWLKEDPGRYATVVSGGAELLECFGDWASAQVVGKTAPVSSGANATEHCLHLGRILEPDWLLLAPNAAGEFCPLAGVVCFPSSWALTEKIGRPMKEVHRPVPGLNEALGDKIQTFLSRMAVGSAWARENWGLSRDAKLNRHPARGLQRLDQTVELNEVWLRVEDQMLFRLGKEFVVFGIRLRIVPLAEAIGDRESRNNFRRALETMSGPVAEYKGLNDVRDRLLELTAA